MECYVPKLENALITMWKISPEYGKPLIQKQKLTFPKKEINFIVNLNICGKLISNLGFTTSSGGFCFQMWIIKIVSLEKCKKGDIHASLTSTCSSINTWDHFPGIGKLYNTMDLNKSKL